MRPGSGAGSLMRGPSPAVVQCASNPVPIGVGYLGQYLIKPLLGFLIAKVRAHPLLHRMQAPSAHACVATARVSSSLGGAFPRRC